MKRNPVTIFIGGFLLLIFILLLFLFQVRTTEVAVVTTFGKVSHTAEAGPHFRWPWPVLSPSAPGSRSKPANATRTGPRTSQASAP